ncbi:putative repeat protein (TIGR01451 family) [Dokdonella fugitiva]|uniref:Putative repeat protein (TIGR01451 family) n=1 Tax=Dokdonella fugitiva TaxID=328517 RepID=A0A4R2I172_9GAMM|nr:putative repeat protein (TIGR01451 family) [Dokdonella fugitiva]
MGEEKGSANDGSRRGTMAPSRDRASVRGQRSVHQPLAALLAAVLLLAASAAQAAVTVNKTFSPPSMTVNGTSTITITLGNTGTSPATAAAVTDTLPGGLVVASPSNVATTCGGTATAAAGGSTIVLGGGTIPPNGGTCAITATVTGSSFGSYTNTIPAGGVTSSQGSNGAAASATLAVLAPQPVTGSYAISWPAGFGGRLKGNGPPASMTLTLNNANTIALTNAALTFSLAQPTLGFATPANTSTTCGSGTVSVNAAAGTATLSGGTIPANGNCTIKFDMIAAQPNVYFFANAGITMPVGTITDDQGISNAAAINASIAVQTGSRVDKAFLPASITSGGTSTLTLTIHNLNFSPLSPIDLTDTFPNIAAGAMTVAPVPNASTTCGGTLTAAPGAGSLQLAGGALPSVAQNANGSVTCTVSVDVVGTNNGTTAINLTNSIPAGSFGGVGHPAVNTNLNVTPNQVLFGSNKVIANEYYAGSLIGTPGTIHAMSIRLVNPASSPLTVTSLLDDLTTMGVGFTVADPPATTTCAGGTVTAPVGGTTISMSGGVVPPGDGTTPGMCTIDTAVYIPMLPSSLGSHTNRIPAGNIVTNMGSNATAITYGIGIVTPVGIGKSFSPVAVNPGGMSTLTINLNRMVRGNATGVDPITNLSDTDVLPAGMIIDTPSGLVTTCDSGTVSAPAGGSTIAFSGIDLDAGENCTIKVNVRVPLGTPPGTLQNLIPAESATTNEGFTNSSRPTSAGAWGNGQAAANLTVASANVTLNKTFTPATVAVGATSQLAISFVNTNPGNIALNQAALTDALPLGMMVATPPAASFTGSGCAGTVSAVAGSTSVGLSNATISAGSTCSLKVNVVGTAAGNLINTIPAGALTSQQGVTNALPATATLQATGSADLSVTKTDGATDIATGTTTTYTVAVANAGPNNVIAATVADTPPAGMTFTGWTCNASPGASCGAASGTGAINDTININVGSTVTYTVTAQLAANFAGSSIANTATITPPGIVSDPAQANNAATDTDTVVPGVVLALTKTDGSTTYTPGGTATYTVTVGNTGAANATQVNVSDTLPNGVTLAGTVTCAPAGTATCGTVTGGAGQGSFGATNATIAGGAGNTLTFSAPVTFASSLAMNPLVNTVNATDVPSGATGSASDSDTLDASANVSIVKTGSTSIVPGGPISYTLTITNAGPSAANGATFNDPLPASLTGASATCGNATGGAVCPGVVSVTGNIVSGTIPTLPSGGSLVITINGTTSPATNAPLSNTATVAPPAGTNDPVPGNNTSTVTTSIKPLVRIDKSVDATTVIPGDVVTYTVGVTNTGPVDAIDTLVTDAMPNGIDTWSWTCVASGGATCPAASGTAALNETIPSLPPGGSVVYTIVATVSTTPPASINNTATATPPDGACAPANTPPPCSASASLPPVPQIGVSKTADTTTVTPGGTIHYTIVVSNTGVLAADGTTVDDPLPAGIASQAWTCSASGGATCTSASGTGAISDVITTFPAGGFVTYDVTATVAPSPPAIVSNTVTVAPVDADSVCTPGNTPGPCVATANVTSNPQVSITKTADTSVLMPGGSVTYTITVTNTGAADADGTTVEDPVPAGIASQAWTCAANAGAVCAASGNGAISDTLAAFPPGSFVTYTIVATIADDPPATITNTATANPPPGSLCTPGNTAAPCDAQVSGGAVPQLSVTKTSDTTGPLTPGGTVTYTITATNSGSADAAGTLVTDTLPPGIASATWTCSASGGAACPNASGTGSVNETIAAFPSGASLVYTIVATIDDDPTASTINNVASVMPPAGVCLPGNTAPPCTATVGNPVGPRIGIQKVADDPSYVAGGTLSWTVTVANYGTANADGTLVNDPLPAGIVSSAWTCIAATGAVCANTTGTGPINETVPTMPPGTSVVFIVTGTVATPAPTSITNIATATPTTGGTCVPGNTPPPCTSTVTTQSAAAVAISKSVADANGNGIAEPGETLDYTITLANPGGSDATAFGVTDALDPNTSFASADNGGAFAGGVVTWSNLTVPAGGNLVLHLAATVDSPLANGVARIANVAYETGATPPTCPPAGPQCAVLPTPGSVTLVKSVLDANGNGIAEPGEALSYSIVLSNSGGSDVAGYAVRDTLDANTVFVSADNGGTQSAGVVTWEDLVIPAGGSLELSVVATVVDTLPDGVDAIANVAYQTGATPPACPPAGPQCAVLPVPGAVTIAKSVADDSGNGLAEPGETLVYAITLSNTGTTDRTGYGVLDPLDPNLVFTSADHGGTFAGGIVSWSGLTVPAGGNLTLTLVATVANPLPPGVTQIGNFAYEAGGTPPLCGTTPMPANCAAIAVAPPGAITISKSVDDASNNGSVEPGESLTYTITLANSGGAVTGFGVTDPLDPNLVFVSADNGGVYAGNSVTWSNLAIPANGSLTLVVTVTAVDPIPDGVTLIRNVAYETGTTPADCGLTPTPASCAVIAVTPQAGMAQLLIQKSANTATTTPGGTVTYTVAVSNVGIAAATNTVITDPLPAGIGSFAWTCTATGGATCPNATGTGALAEIIATLPAGAGVTYTITAVLLMTPPASIVNVADASSSGTSVCAPSGSPPPCTSQATVTVTPVGPGQEPIPTPIDSRWMLLLMTLALVGAAAHARRKA